VAYLDMAAPDVFKAATRSGVEWWTTVGAAIGGTSVATGLLPVGGTITDTTAPGVRRVLNVDLAPDVGQTADELYDLISEWGTLLTVTGHVRLTGRTVVDIPMGVFDVDKSKVSGGNGQVSLTADDKWAKVQRARFVLPQASTPGLLVTEQIAALIRGALGAAEPVVITATSTATVGALTWEKDRDKAIIDLADGIGAWVFFDRTGLATIADVPTTTGAADWLIDAGVSGVLIDIDREKSREGAANVWVVESSAADEAKFPTVVVWDIESASPTFAGLDPTSPSNVPGPFGVVTGYLDTPILATEDQARQAAYTRLSRSAGASSSVSLGSVPNLAVDAFDVLDVLPPHKSQTIITGYRGGGSGFGTMPFGTGPFGGGSGGGVPILGRASVGAVMERHVADTVTHPLTIGSPQTIEGRSTRTVEAGSS